MKLLYCRRCHDCVKLSSAEVRSCSCGRVSGRYLDNQHDAEVSGKDAEVIALGNLSLLNALKSDMLEHPEMGLGPDVQAWMFPHNYFRIDRKA